MAELIITKLYCLFYIIDTLAKVQCAGLCVNMYKYVKIKEDHANENKQKLFMQSLLWVQLSPLVFVRDSETGRKWLNFILKGKKRKALGSLLLDTAWRSEREVN